MFAAEAEQARHHLLRKEWPASGPVLYILFVFVFYSDPHLFVCVCVCVVQRRMDFTLRDQAKVIAMQWNSNSDILAVGLQLLGSSKDQKVRS